MSCRERKSQCAFTCPEHIESYKHCYKAYDTTDVPLTKHEMTILLDNVQYLARCKTSEYFIWVVIENKLRRLL